MTQSHSLFLLVASLAGQILHCSSKTVLNLHLSSIPCINFNTKILRRAHDLAQTPKFPCFSGWHCLPTFWEGWNLRSLSPFSIKPIMQPPTHPVHLPLFSPPGFTTLTKSVSSDTTLLFQVINSCLNVVPQILTGFLIFALCHWSALTHAPVPKSTQTFPTFYTAAHSS